MQKYYKGLAQCLTVVLLSVFSLVLANSSQAAPTVVNDDCLAPVPTQVNPLTKRINLDWSKVVNATSFNLQILPLGGVCGVTAPMREIKDIARASYYTLPDDVACGLVTVCVQTNCCNDRCDSCQIDPNKDYCTDMADKYLGACGCNGYGGTPGTFKYKYAGSKVIGCSWECVQGFSGGTPKSCGTDYKIECGKPPHDTIVGAKPFYGLCNVFDSVRMRPDGDGYLVNPPGVGTSGSLLYTWNCLGAKTSCMACRRAVCATEFQGKTLTTKPNEATLCLENGVMTADPSKINLRLSPDGKQWLWDCIGAEQCGTDKANRNWVDGSMQDHCSAKALVCGWGHKEYVTYETLNNNSNGVNVETYKAFGNGQGRDLGAFWCANGGRVEQPYRNNQPVPAPLHMKAGKIDTLKWRCVYDNQASSVNCQANLIACNTDLDAKKLIQTSFDLYRNPVNLCQAGDASKPFAAGLVNVSNNGAASSNVFNWECVDKFFARAGYNSLTTKCSAKETACAVPPTGGYFKNIDELNNQVPLCVNAVQLPVVKTDVNSSTIDGWSWACDDSFGKRTQCAAKRLTCATPPDKKSYTSWTEFAAASVSCENTADDNIKNCTGVCNKAGEKVVVTRDAQTNVWSWTCGEDKCGADYGAGLGCGTANKSRHTNKYWDKNKNNSQFLCKDGSKPTITHKDGGWSWNCGSDACSAFEVNCGALGEDWVNNDPGDTSATRAYTKINWDKKIKANLPVNGNLCLRARKITPIASSNNITDLSGVSILDIESRSFDVREPGNSARDWWCYGDDDDSADRLWCDNSVVECGNADANHYINKNVRIRPKTGGLPYVDGFTNIDGWYHGSFNDKEKNPLTDNRWNSRCMGNDRYNKFGIDEKFDPNSNRGAYTWDCRGDSDGQGEDSTLHCSARKDCGWAGPEETGYATVYFSENTARTNGQAAGCWTAENIKAPVKHSFAGWNVLPTDMFWYEALGKTDDQYKTDGYDGFNHGTKQANYRVSDTQPETGICPVDWEVPSSSSWHLLEYSLHDVAHVDGCDPIRFQSRYTYGCSPAATSKSVLGYGLNSPITFDGLSFNSIYEHQYSALESVGPKYLTKTSPCSPGFTNVIVSKGFDDRTLCKRMIDHAIPIFFEFYLTSNSDKVGRMEQEVQNNYTNGSLNFDYTGYSLAKLRCVKSSTIATPNPCAEWEKFYQEVFGLKVDLSKVPMPSSSIDLNFLQCMPAGLSYGQVHDKEKEFAKNQGLGIMDWDNNWPALINLNLEERRTTKSYAIRHSGLAEAENTYANRSANWIAQNKIKTMTRLERAAFGLYYYWKNKANIDLQQITYCTGSRHTNGGVPYVNWFGNALSSNWVDATGARDIWRPRPVLAL